MLVSGRFTNKVKQGVNEILVLGEHTIFALRETDGELLMQVWVCVCSYGIACMHTYSAGGMGKTSRYTYLVA